MFKIGDRYIQFTQTGEVNFGVVKHIHEAIVCDKANQVQYVSVSIINKQNELLELDGTDGRIYRVINDLTEDNIKEYERRMSIGKTKPVPSV